MRKILLIALLIIMGCEGFGVFKHEHDGICVRRNGVYRCSDSFTHKECLYKERNYGSAWVYAWYSDITCKEFCNELIDGESSTMDCEIDNDF